MIKILKCNILESNSGALDPKSDALPVQLSMTWKIQIITLKM